MAAASSSSSSAPSFRLPAGVKEEMTKLFRDLAGAHLHVKQLEGAVAQEAQRSQQLQAEIETLRSEKEALQSSLGRVRTLEAEVAELREKLASEEERREKLEGLMRDRYKEQDDQERQFDDLTQENDELKNALQQANEELKKERDARSEASQQLHRMEESYRLEAYHMHVWARHLENMKRAFDGPAKLQASIQATEVQPLRDKCNGVIKGMIDSIGREADQTRRPVTPTPSASSPADDGSGTSRNTARKRSMSTRHHVDPQQESEPLLPESGASRFSTDILGALTDILEQATHLLDERNEVIQRSIAPNLPPNSALVPAGPTSAAGPPSAGPQSSTSTSKTSAKTSIAFWAGRK